MQYILSSSFVSLVASVNVGISILLSILGCPYLAIKWPQVWMFQATVGTCGVIFNIYVLLHSKRKLYLLTKSLKPVKAYFMLIKNALADLRCLLVDLMDFQFLKIASNGFPCQHFGFSGLLTYLRTSNAMYLGSRHKKVTSRDFQTPDFHSMPQKNKVNKTQSDPAKKPEKLSIKEKYLPAKSPELFKNKIYLTRRNLTNALSND